MKKLLLVAATTALVSAGSASAFEGFDGMYVHGKVGYNVPAGGLKKGLKAFKSNEYIKAKKSKGIASEIGIGYYITPNIRTELNINIPFNLKASSKQTKDAPNFKNFKSNTKADIKALMIKTYFDMPISEGFKAYVGGGVGLSRIAMKFSSAQDLLVENQFVNTTSSVKTKNNISLAFSGTVGGSMEVSEGVNIYADYTYTNYGRAAKKAKATAQYGQNPSVTESSKVKSPRLSAHAISVGLRFDI